MFSPYMRRIAQHAQEQEAYLYQTMEALRLLGLHASVEAIHNRAKQMSETTALSYIGALDQVRRDIIRSSGIK